MFQIIIINLLLTLPIMVLAQSAVPQIDGKCPWGTMKSGDYCVPKVQPGGGHHSYILKSGNNCPYGYQNVGESYCMKGAGNEPESIPREPGKNCPYKWYKSGNYCWKGR